MRFDSTLTGFVLKTQPLAEADVLVTWYTKEQGKVRAVAASARRTHSRLAFALQPAAFSAVRLVGRSKEQGLLKMAGATPQKTFLQNYSEAQSLALSWFFEVLLRSTPDAEPSEQLFLVAEDFFTRLGSAQTGAQVSSLVAYTLLHVLSALGMAVHEDTGEPVYFSVQGGGFFIISEHHDKVKIVPELWQRYQLLAQMNTSTSGEFKPESVDKELLSFLHSFLEYQLERPIRSYQFLNAIMNSEL